MEQLVDFVLYIDGNGVCVHTECTSDKKYKTKVLPVSKNGVNLTEYDINWYKSPEEARVGHVKKVLKYQKDGLIMQTDEYINFIG